jgi:hypothetical protein
MDDIDIRIQLDGLTGVEGTDTVQGVNSASLVENAITIGFASNKSYLYKYDTTSAEVHDGTSVIQPCNSPATGRHLLQSSFEGKIDHDSLTNFVAGEHKTIAEARTDTGAIVIESRTDDSVTVTGRLWLRTDL